jgi:hypothetical protein
LGALSAGEASFRGIAINMGLLSDDTNSDAKYNIEKEASKCNKDNAKEWIVIVGFIVINQFVVWFLRVD